MRKKVCKLVQKYLRWFFDILVLLAVTDPLVSSGYLADRCSIAIFFMNYVKLASLDPLWPFHFPSFSLFFACCDAKVLSLERIRSTRALLIRHLARKGLFFKRPASCGERQSNSCQVSLDVLHLTSPTRLSA